MPLNLYSSATTDSLLAAKLSDAPIDGSTYGRNNGAWAIVTGGGLTISTLSNAATSTLNATAPTSGQALTFDGTDLVWEIPGVGFFLPIVGGIVTGQITVDESGTSGFSAEYKGSGVFQTGNSMYVSFEEQLVHGLNLSLPVGGSITFGDATVQTTAAVSGVTSDKAIANAFAASMWYLSDGYDYARNGVVNTNYIGGSYLSAGISDGTTFAVGFPATNATLNTSEYWYVSINGTLSDIFIFSP